MLAAEGLFAADRKRPLPFLPRTIGLITGRASAAERDVVENARRRCPGSGSGSRTSRCRARRAVNEVVDALGRLDADAAGRVIVIARGGGSVEDLLPFSNETLVRAVSRRARPSSARSGTRPTCRCSTWSPTWRASTPTDAAKRIVPDLAEETARDRPTRGPAPAPACTAGSSRERELMAGLPDRLRGAVRRRVQARAGPSRPRCAHAVAGAGAGCSTPARADLEHVRARVRALSPQATLDRGYAVVRTAGRHGGARRPPRRIGRLRIRVAAASSAR